MVQALLYSFSKTVSVLITLLPSIKNRQCAATIFFFDSRRRFRFVDCGVCEKFFTAMNALFRRSASSAADGPANSDAAQENSAEEQFLLLASSNGEESRNEAKKRKRGETRDRHYFPVDRDRRLLIGAYPRSPSEIEHLRSAEGVRCFVNLTSDRSYEAWFLHDDGDSIKNKTMKSSSSSSSSMKNGKVFKSNVAQTEFLYRPMLRRDEVSDDGKVLNVCREIVRWLETHAKTERIYVHSELGYGRAAVVGAVIAGDLEQLQTNRAIAFIEQRRATFRSDYQDERIVPTVETNAQVEQIFRLLGNPQRSSEEEEDEQGIRAIAKKKIGEKNAPKDEEEDEQDHDDGQESDEEKGGFAPLETEEDQEASTTLNKYPNTQSNKGVQQQQKQQQQQQQQARGVLHSKETEYIALPDRSDRSWRIKADKWIKERKISRKALTREQEQRAEKKHK